MGAGRSGTTILGILLNQVSNLEHVGEINKFFEFKGIPHGFKTETKHYQLYTGIYKSLLLKIHKKRINLDHKTDFHTRLLFFMLGIYNKNKVSNYVVCHDLLLGTLAENFDKTIIDSSKYCVRALILNKYSSFNIKIIFLRRSIYSVYKSFSKTGIEQPNKSFINFILYYSIVNLSSIIVYFNYNKHNRHYLKYENLTFNTFDELVSIREKFMFDIKDLFKLLYNQQKLKTGLIFEGNRIRLNNEINFKLQRSPSIEHFGIKFNTLCSNEIFFSNRSFNHIATVNSEFIVKANKCKQFNEILRKCSCTIDGQLPFLIIKLFNLSKPIFKISGSSLIYNFAQYCRVFNKKIFLLGSSKQINTLAVEKLIKNYGISAEGYSPEFECLPFKKDNNDNILKRISKFKPDVLFVGFGCGKQEFWINENRSSLIDSGIKYAVGCGGSFDFVAGKTKRAPKIFQVLCLEGLYRLIKEPKFFRFKRLMTSLLVFRYFFLRE